MDRRKFSKLAAMTTAALTTGCQTLRQSTRIDSHQHFWVYNKTDYTWMANDYLKKDFLPSDLKPHLKSMNYDGCVAVQARQFEKETDFLIDLAKKAPYIKGIVGWVDLRADNVAERIAHFKEKSDKISGFRHVVHDEADDQFMARKDFQRGLQALQDANLTYDFLIFEKHLPLTFEVAKKFPKLNFVIDHMANPRNLANWKASITKFKPLKNVYCKLSGMTPRYSKVWQPEDFHSRLDTCLETFGAERLMIGSDWPVCEMSGTYNRVMSITEAYIQKLSTSEKEAILGENAAKFYKL